MTSQANSWIVIGGGVQGITAAALLARRGRSVVMIEKAEALGAVLNGPERDGLFLDNGCHMFANEDVEATDLFMDILGDRFLTFDVRYASVTEGRRTDGMAVANFSHLPATVRTRILMEIARSRGTPGTRTDMASALAARYGQTLANRLRGPVRKMTLREPEELAANTISKSPFGRVSISGQTFGNLLKRAPVYDAVLAVSSERDPMRFYQEAARVRNFRYFYPAEKGTRGFCDMAEAYLRKAGVDIRFGRTVAAIREEGPRVLCHTDDGQATEAAGLVWALDPGALARVLWGEDPLQGHMVPVPMVLYYFLVPAEAEVPYTYIHDFSPETRVFRASSPGFYGRQRNAAGLSYLCAEVPAAMDSELWREPEQATDGIWREMVGLRMIDLDRPTSTIIRKTPVSYPLNGPSYAPAYAELSARLESEHARVLATNPNLFGKVEIIRNLTSRLEAVAS